MSSSEPVRTQNIIFLQGVTFPHTVSQQNKKFEELDEKFGKSRYVKVKSGKYVLYVLYYSRMGTGASANYILRKKRIVIGVEDKVDYADGINNVHPLIVKEMRKKFANVLINSPTFDENAFKTSNMVLSKRFWWANLLWGHDDSLETSFRTVSAFIQQHYPLVLDTITSKKSGSEFLKKKLPQILEGAVSPGTTVEISTLL